MFHRSFMEYIKYSKDRFLWGIKLNQNENEWLFCEAFEG